MKAIEFIMYFLIFNAVLGLFTTMSVYGGAAALQSDEDWKTLSNNGDEVKVTQPFDLLDILGFEGIGVGVILGATTIGISYLTNASPYIALAYGVMTGMFAGMWVNMFSWFDKLIVWSQGSDALGVLTWLKYLIGAVFIFMFVWGLIQMATGGAKGQE